MINLSAPSPHHAPALAPTLRFEKAKRLRTLTDFNRTKQGRRFRVGVVSLTRFAYLREQQKGEDAPPLAFPLRFGFVIPKRSFKRAVHRNRAKRLLREYCRIHYAALCQQVKRGEGQGDKHLAEDWVFVVGKYESEAQYRADFTQLISQQRALTAHHGVGVAGAMGGKRMNSSR